MIRALSFLSFFDSGFNLGMPYKLLLSEEISPAIRRIGLEQLTKVRRELSSTQNMQAGVHKSRSCLKRFRSLLRLARPILGEDVFRKENKKHRDIARALAQPRQAGAMLETITKLETRDDFSQYLPLILELKSLIQQQKESSETELELISLSSLVEKIDASIERWKNRSLDDVSFESLAHGFAQTYDRGRESLMVAIEKDDNFYLHEWRKDVQQTWRHMQILTLIWPEDIMPRIRLAREVSRLLGTENDLSDIERFMKAHKKTLKKKKDIKALYKPFRSTLRTLCRDLSLHAVERGRRLYAFEAEALSNAMTIYWKTSRALQPMPAIVLELTDIDKTLEKKVHKSTADQANLKTAQMTDAQKPKLSALERMRAANASLQEQSNTTSIISISPKETPFSPSEKNVETLKDSNFQRPKKEV